MHIAERTTEGRAFPSADGHSSEAEILSSTQRNDDNWLYIGAPVSLCVQPQTARYEFKDGRVLASTAAESFVKEILFCSIVLFPMPLRATLVGRYPACRFLVQSSLSQIHIFSVFTLSVSHTVACC